MANKIVTFNGKALSGPGRTGMAIVRGPATMTIRFKFTTNNNSEDPGNFDPSDAECKKGTWNKVEEVVDEYSIWDWIYTGANASKAFDGIFTYNYEYDKEIVSINCTSEITDVSELFKNCVELDGLSIAYNYLSQMTVKHDNCFYRAGGNLQQYAEIADIPEDWGGTKPLTGRGIKLGNYIWDSDSIGVVDIPGLVEIDEHEDFEPGTIGYLERDYVIYYTKAAIDYIKNHPEILKTNYDGWHLPTYEEGDDLADYFYDYKSHNYYRINTVAFLQTDGNNGFNMGFSNWNPADTDITYGDSVLEYDTNMEEWVYGAISYFSYEPLRDYVCWPFQIGYLRLDNDGSNTAYISARDDSYYINEPSYMYPIRLVRDHN